MRLHHIEIKIDPKVLNVDICHFLKIDFFFLLAKSIIYRWSWYAQYDVLAYDHFINNFYITYSISREEKEMAHLRIWWIGMLLIQRHFNSKLAVKAVWERSGNFPQADVEAAAHSSTAGFC